MPGKPFIDIKLDPRELRRLERQLRSFPKAMPRVMSRSINKTVTSARVLAAREITQKVNLTVTRAKRAMILTKATYSRWLAEIHFQKRRIRLIEFKARQTAKGVTYKIKKSGPRQLLAGAFIAKVRKGQRSENLGVYGRKFKKGSTHRVARYPIVQQRGPSIGKLFEDDPHIVSSVTSSASANFTKFIVAQVKLIFK